jgi:hypothetical protein
VKNRQNKVTKGENEPNAKGLRKEELNKIQIKCPKNVLNRI